MSRMNKNSDNEGKQNVLLRLAKHVDRLINTGNLTSRFTFPLFLNYSLFIYLSISFNF